MLLRIDRVIGTFDAKACEPQRRAWIAAKLADLGFKLARPQRYDARPVWT
jgi:hypothetical protein